MRIVGLDLSLTSTGIAVITGADVALTRVQPSDKLSDHARIDHTRSRVADHLGAAGLVVIELTTYGQTTGKAHERAGLWWIVTRMLWRARIPYATVTAQQLKKYATGSGSGPNSGKDRVLAAAIKRYPTVNVDGNDVADALILAAMGADHLGHPLATVPQAHRAALTAVRWPAIPRPPDAPTSGQQERERGTA